MTARPSPNPHRAMALLLPLLAACPGDGQLSGPGVDRGPDGALVAQDGPSPHLDADRHDGAWPRSEAGPQTDAAADGSHADAISTGPDSAPAQDVTVSPDSAVPPVCQADSCSGHGVCSVSNGVLSCTCDEGFTGATCSKTTADFWRRTLIRKGMGDPNILRVNDDLYYLTGTEGGCRSITVYRSTDLQSFKAHVTYDPSKVDTKHDYCHLWAPDMVQEGSGYRLYFSALRIANGASCPSPGGSVTTWTATAPDAKLAFSAPKMINPGTSYPRTYPTSGCPSQGCSRAIRIDPDLYQQGTSRRLFYTWFSGGNNISSFDLSSPGTVTHHTGPATKWSVTGAEGIINEAPDVLRKDGRTTLLFSVDDFRKGYAIWYLQASTVGGLTRARQPLAMTRPVRTQGGALLRNHGHSSITHRRGQWFQLFHIGRFSPPGTYVGRDTFKQRIKFKADGSLHSLSEVQVLWSRIPGYSYSLDVVTRSGKVYGPCVNSGILGQKQTWSYRGVCPSSGNALVPKPDVATFRVFYSNNGTWNKHAEVSFDGVADQAFVKLPGGSSPFVMLLWNQLQTTAEYSLDVQRADGSWVAPCAGEYVLGHKLGYTYNGSCPTAGTSVPVGQVQRFRICSAVNNDWGHATCAAVKHEGSTMRYEIVLP